MQLLLKTVLVFNISVWSPDNYRQKKSGTVSTLEQGYSIWKKNLKQKI